MVPSMVNNGRCLSTKVNEKGKNQADSICLKYSGQDGVESKTIGHEQAEEMKQQKQGIFGPSSSPMWGADGYNAVDKISKIQVHTQFLQCLTLIQDKVDPVYLQELIGLHVSLLKENDNDEATVDHTAVTTKQNESEAGEDDENDEEEEEEEEKETTADEAGKDKEEEATLEDDEDETTTASSKSTEEKACVPVEEQEESGVEAESSDEPVVQDPPTPKPKWSNSESIQDMLSTYIKQCRDKGHYERAQRTADDIYERIVYENNLKMKGREE